jgi:UDP-N-acetylmuramyl tripeptide synthase
MTRHGGTALPGKVLLAVEPRAISLLAAQRAAQSICVSATNGKTTLTAMLARVCTAAGRTYVHNMSGANLRSGVASALLAARGHSDLALLECDEAALPSIVLDAHPGVIVLGNLFRDQLDRYGELEIVAERWERMLERVSPETVVVFCADDPLIAHVVMQYRAAAEMRGTTVRTLSFGCNDVSVAAPSLPHAADSTMCRTCDRPLVYERSFVGHLGHYSCTRCGFRRPDPDIAATRVTLEGLGATTIELSTPDGPISARLKVPGLYNVYNALGAAASAGALGCEPDQIAQGLNGFVPAFGRFERVAIPSGGTLTLLLVKNPTGLNEVVRTVVDAKVDLSSCLFALNDGIADGRDTSWIWDADVEPLLGAVPGLVVTGDRAAEFALRAVYGGMDSAKVHVEEDLETALYEVLERAQVTTTHGHAYALVTYTAMLRIREVLHRKGWTTPYWQGGAS